MATYASLSELKAVLKITDSSQDTLLTSFLERSEAIINSYIGVDTLTTSTQTQRFPACSVTDLIFDKRPVTAISKVNGVAVTWVNGTDYIVEHGRVVNVLDVAKLLDGVVLDTFTIEYTAGYATIPKDIVFCELLIASNMYATMGTNVAYQSYSIGEEKVVFKSDSDAQQTKSILNRYCLA